MDNNKNDQKLHKKCKLFVKRLASKFKQDDAVSCLKSETLESAFRDAIHCLPTGPVGQIFLSNFDKYFKILKRFCKLEDYINGATVEPVNSKTEFPFNLYLKKGNNIRDDVDVSEEDRQKLCCHFMSKKLQANCSNVVLTDVLQKFQDDQHTAGDKFREVDDCMKMLRLSTGSDDAVVVIKIMEIFLGKIQPCADKCISGKKANRAGTLAEQIRHFLSICHMRYHSLHQTTDHRRPRYEDVIAAILSVYVDLCLVYSTKADTPNKLKRRVCDVTSYLLSDWPVHILDVLLQTSCVQPKNAEIILPLIRKSLDHKPDGTAVQFYLKYILTVQKLTQELGDTMEEFKQATMRVKAPKQFLNWLREENPDILEEMPEDKHFKGRQITKFLLEEVTQETVSQLMDLLKEKDDDGDDDDDGGDDGVVEEFVTSESSPQQLTNGLKEQVTTDQSGQGVELFYIDTKGNSTKGQSMASEDEEVEASDKIVICDDVIEDEDVIEIINIEEEEENAVEELANDAEDIEQTDNTDTQEALSVVHDTIQEIQETLKNRRVTRSAKKLFDIRENNSDVMSKRTESQSPNYKKRNQSPQKDKKISDSRDKENVSSDGGCRGNSEEILEIIDDGDEGMKSGFLKSRERENASYLVQSPENLKHKSPGKNKNMTDPKKLENTSCYGKSVDVLEIIDDDGDDFKKSRSLESGTKKSPIKSGVVDLTAVDGKRTSSLINTEMNSSINSEIISDSESEYDDNSRSGFLPQISEHLKKTPKENASTTEETLEKRKLNCVTPVSKKLKKQDDSIVQSSEGDELRDFMSPVISVKPIRNKNNSVVKNIVRTTRLQTRSMTVTPTNQSTLDNYFLNKSTTGERAETRKSLPAVATAEDKEIDEFNDKQVSHSPLKSATKSKQSHENQVEGTNAESNRESENDVIFGGYSLRQTRKRTISEISHTSVTSEKLDGEKNQSFSVRSAKDKSLRTTKVQKNLVIKIDDIDVIEMSDNSDSDDQITGTQRKTLLDVDNEITFNLPGEESTSTAKVDKDAKKNRRKSEPVSIRTPALKQFSSSSKKSRRYSLRHK